ncbi:MAG: polyhydroxyalkanoate synthesis regulator DNA-binding domain-containing protein [Anaerolineales bacterium]|nr:polyhydroxyalkanoate synthesis regulator DNA-binding domain-containing protein [Anaerolineales bacterium]
MTEEKPVIIKRYANRKLYDVEQRSYITLDKVTRLVQSGMAIQVIDHVTGEDLTSRVYAQILFELEKQKRGTLPENILNRLVQAGEKGWAHIREGVVSGPELAALVDQEITERLHVLEAHGELPAENVSNLKDLLLIQSQRIRILSASVQKEESSEQQEVIDTLRRQLKNLEKRIQALEK